MLVHGAGFLAVHIQIGHVGAVCIDLVDDPIGMHSRVGYTVSAKVIPRAAVIITKKRTLIFDLEQVRCVLDIGRSIRQQHTVVIHLTAPLDDPFVIRLQHHRTVQLVNGTLMYAILNGPFKQGNSNFSIALFRHTDQTVAPAVIFPAGGHGALVRLAVCRCQGRRRNQADHQCQSDYDTDQPLCLLFHSNHSP